MSRFDSLIFEHSYPVSPATLWQGWSAPTARAIWAAPTAEVTVEILRAEDHLDGVEISLCRAAGRPDTLVESRWLEISAPQSSVNAEVVRVEGRTLSCALITAEISPEGDGGSQLRVTVQLSASEAGMAQGYQDGFTGSLNQLEALCRRMMVIERDIAAPPDRIWQALSDHETLAGWWGPAGFHCRSTRFDQRPGGDWLFDMIGPDGTVYPNQHRYGAVEPPHHLSYALCAGEGGPRHADAWLRIAETATGARVTLGMIFVDAETYAGAMAIGAEALGLQTLDKLARTVERT